jgi:hypothetical protein
LSCYLHGLLSFTDAAEALADLNRAPTFLDGLAFTTTTTASAIYSTPIFDVRVPMEPIQLEPQLPFTTNEKSA